MQDTVTFEKIEEEGQAHYEVKTVQYHSPDQATQFGLMMVGVDCIGHTPLNDEGYSGRYVMFVPLAGGAVDATHDPYKLNYGRNTDGFRDFCMAMREGWQNAEVKHMTWDVIDDGSRITPERAEELKERAF